ncbi:sensor histidine kinase [Microbacterium hydrocarbonoxydans]|uniref:sensor histidine kinase n=1 Tax=Microbacterium hydrocarbonoxydans TaxID=273678 RepID=UPI0013D9AB0A|nr:histidine kinase [Microbacterium hydrocarbonoxydans]
MEFASTMRRDATLLRLSRGESLTTPERIVVLVIAGGVVVLDALSLVLTRGADPVATLFSIVTTSAFALYLWSPLWATCALGIMFVLSFLTENETQVLLAVAVAAGLIMRLGWTSLILAYVGAFLVGTGIIAYGDLSVPVNVGIYLIVATLAGAIGFGLRLAFARGRRLELQLEQQVAEQAEQEREAVLAERRWIAGELHDSIAHHLTVVALHVQMLDDATVSASSQEAIRIAARKAMADLRFVIELADDGPRSAGVQTGDLAAAIDEARSEFEAAGHDVVLRGDPRDERIPRAAEIILARIVRESATNVLKYAGEGAVSVLLDVDDESVALTILSPLPLTPRRELSSSGTGLGRMAERVIGASGEFSAGESEGLWRVLARVPLV